MLFINMLLGSFIDNLNEKRKLRVQEKNVLLSLHNETLNEKKILPYNQRKNNFVLFKVSGWIYVPDNG